MAFRRLRMAALHLSGSPSSADSHPGNDDPPLGSLDGLQPPLRCFTAADLGSTDAAADVPSLCTWPKPLQRLQRARARVHLVSLQRA